MPAPKAKESPTKATRANPRYAGSLAEKMDKALMAGGTYADIAKAIGKPAGLVRGHAKFRAKGGKFKLVETEDHVRLEAVA
jgi:hypothetical protein